MKRLLIAITLLLSAPAVMAAGGGDLLYSGVNAKDKASVQRGLSTYMQYCSGCHASEYVRYGRIAKDLNLTEADLKNNHLMPRQAKMGDRIVTPLNAEMGTEWFGKAPPDLTLIARSRTADWLFTYFKSFYRDSEGQWDNSLMSVSMPHVFWAEQGIQEAVYHGVTNPSTGEEEQVIDHLEVTEAGLLNAEQYDTLIRDLVAYLVYIGEPAQYQRVSTGKWVILFLSLLAFLAYLLKAEYWRDVH